MPVVVVVPIAIPETLLVVAAPVPLEALVVHARLRLMIVLAHRLHRRLEIAFITVVVAELIARLQVDRRHSCHRHPVPRAGRGRP